MGWLTKLVKRNYRPKLIAEKVYTKELKLGQTNNLIQLNEHIQNISLFSSLKLFKHYNKVVQ